MSDRTRLLAVYFEGVRVGHIVERGAGVCHVCMKHAPRTWALHTILGSDRLVTCEDCSHGEQGLFAGVLNKAQATFSATEEVYKRLVNKTVDFLTED